MRPASVSSARTASVVTIEFQNIEALVAFLQERRDAS